MKTPIHNPRETPTSPIEEIRARVADAIPAGRTALEDKALEAYRERNESLDECVEYRLTRNGFFAEYHDLAMTMLWAWVKGQQLVLDSSRFLYAPDSGWAEYFERFCRRTDEVDPGRVAERFEFNPKLRAARNTQVLRDHRPEKIRIGDVLIEGYDNILDFLKRMIFRLNEQSRSAVAQTIRSVGLPVEYLAAQIRRGDKLGEDVYYPVEMYLASLGELTGRETIFVMTDDYRTIHEVQSWLDRQGLGIRLITLCDPRDRGFNIGDLRKDKAFTRGLEPHEEPLQVDSRRQHTLSLFAETLLASGASRIATTERSFLGLALRALSCRPESVSLLTVDDVARFAPPALRRGRHILDAYQKVLMISPGVPGARFFSAVLSALNQVAFAERERYLPVVDFNSGNWARFHDPDRGDDVWSCYFEPVAGYTPADIEAMIRNPDDPLTTDHVIRLSDEEIVRICHFDTRSVFHYPLGHWRGHRPADLRAWYSKMRRRGHRLVSRHLAIHSHIVDRADAFAERVPDWRNCLGVHIRGTDLAYAPPITVDDYLRAIDEQLERRPFDAIFLATDQLQYLDRIARRYGDRLVYQDCLRSGDGRNPSDLPRPSRTDSGTEVLVDCLLLARCPLVLRGPSSIAEFALYLDVKGGSLDLGRNYSMPTGLDYTKPEADSGEYPGAWELLGSKRHWTPPRVTTTAG